MSITISAYQLWKIEVPTGRLIGDCTCHYDALDVLVVRLETNQGRHGWGFGEAVSKGVFAKSAPWITPMPSLDELRREFDREVWPILQGKNPLATKLHRPELFSGHSYLPTSVRIA
jgi:L-alanine-DL-glutamate epimerase-like enolase superfamily enzyme